MQGRRQQGQALDDGSGGVTRLPGARALGFVLPAGPRTAPPTSRLLGVASWHLALQGGPPRVLLLAVCFCGRVAHVAAGHRPGCVLLWLFLR